MQVMKSAWGHDKREERGRALLLTRQLWRDGLEGEATPRTAVTTAATFTRANTPLGSLLTVLHAFSHWTLSITSLVRTTFIQTFCDEKTEAQENFLLCSRSQLLQAGPCCEVGDLSQGPALYTSPASHFRSTPGGLSRERKYQTTAHPA